MTAESGAARFAARSLADPELRRFLRDNLGHDASAVDFETLCWAALFYHPGLELARAQWETAKAGQAFAGQRPNPTLTVSPGYNFTRESGVSPWMPAIAADLLLPTAGKRTRQQEIAAAEAAAARAGVSAAVWQVRAELRKALVEAALAHRKAILLQTQAAAQRAVVGLIEQRVTAGAVATTEAATARTALLRLELAAGDAVTAETAARVQVAAALGLPLAAIEGIALPMPPTLPPLTADAVAGARAGALRARADVVSALAKYQAAQAALELELARRFPDVHLGPSYQWDQGQNKWSLGLTVELPLNGNSAAIRQALARRNEAAAEFNVVQNRAVAEIDGAAAALAAATRQLQHTRQLIDELQLAVKRVDERRRLGAADALEVATAGLESTAAAVAQAEAEAAIVTAAGQLESALQVPSDEVERMLRATPNKPISSR